MKAELSQLIALQKTDTNIRTLQAEIESIPERRAEIEKEFDQRAFEIRELEQTRDTAFHEKARLEKEIFEQKSRLERAERNLKAVKKPDEYKAAIREADSARKQISAYETNVLEQMEVFDGAESALKERAPEVEKLREDVQARFVAFDEQVARQQKELDQARAERERMMKDLPKPMASMFNRISARIRDGIAVARAHNGACTACYMALRPQIMADVRRGNEVITCDNCNRILYYEPENVAQPAAVS